MGARHPGRERVALLGHLPDPTLPMTWFGGVRGADSRAGLVRGRRVLLDDSASRGPSAPPSALPKPMGSLLAGFADPPRPPAPVLPGWPVRCPARATPAAGRGLGSRGRVAPQWSPTRMRYT